MNNHYKVYSDIKSIIDLSKDYIELQKTYKSINLTLNDIKNVPSYNSKLTSLGIFMIVAVPEPIISDMIGLMLLSLGSIFIKKEKIDSFILNNLYSVKKELDDLYDIFIIDHHI